MPSSPGHGMDHLRRASAPRLIDWTGERMVPWTDDVQVVYEHLHRYWLAAELAAGRRVLDLGSGEGYGSAILASVAASVDAIEIDPQTVRHAQANYTAPNLAFATGSALDLSRYDEDAFDLVVCFEVIEHVTEQERLLDEVDRVLAPGGLLICSTPDTVNYSEIPGHDNPFHERELTREEFAALLARHFGATRQWGQRTITGSLLHADAETWPEGAEVAEPQEAFVSRDGDHWRRAAAPEPVYMVAVAARETLPPLPRQSVLADTELTLLRVLERRMADAQNVLAGENHRLEDENAQLRGHVERAQVQIERLEDEVGERHAAFEVAERTRAALRAGNDDLERELAEAKGYSSYLYGEIEIAHGELKRIEESASWQALQRARTRVAGTDERRTIVGHAISGAVKAKRALRRRPAAIDGPAQPAGDEATGVAAGPRIVLPEHPEPKVSIVVPVHDQPELTLACLRAIALDTTDVPYEVIVVDDASGPELQAALGRVDHLRVLRNDENLHFLRTANRGAEAARGEYVVFLNNDTEVREGWLRALVETADADPTIGAVGAKLLLPDHRVQEAGAIVFSDGGAWHVGRGEHPDEPRLNYVRDVDYASAACLLVRADALAAVGGLDERYAPAYYEDVDLCFALRRHGLRVVYQPRAAVIHHEGSSHGTDVAVGVKAYQVRNQEVFAEKWADVLAGHPAREPGREREREYAEQDRRPGPRLLVVDHDVPDPLQDAGSLRMYYMLRALVRLGCRVTFLPDNHAHRGATTVALQQLGVEVLYGPFQPRLVLQEMGDGLDLVLVSRPTVAWGYIYLLREFNPQATIVYDTVDLHYLREERRAATSDHAALARVSEVFLEMESGLVRQTDETLAVSAEEAEAVRKLVPGADVRVLPTLHPLAEHVPGPVGREGLLFVGNFQHQPNVDAARHLVQDVLPLVREELGEVPVWIVGGKPTKAVEALGEAPGVEVTGFVESIEPYFERARVMVAPLRYGAGVKGKITQSLALGLPVVTTDVGAEGLEAEAGTDLLVGNTARELADHIVSVYHDGARWQELSEAGRELARRRFAPEVAEQVLGAMLGLDAVRSA
jgi:GT2 family glycosyltransferase/2-polyprenyl-3-methyl-5-hydroxy-6-metoxy-1,4-benzoquinol methylase